MSSKTYYNQQVEPIGTLGEDKIFRKKVRSKIHLYHNLDAWGVDKEVVDDLLKKGCTDIWILDNDEMIIYGIKLKDFVEKAENINWGYSLQSFVPRSYWRKELLRNKQQKLI